MVSNVKPVIVVSRCLGFAPCRYNSGIENNQFVQKLSEFVDIITVCPEVDSGLPIPRDPVRLVQNGENIDIVQPKTMKNYTESMKNFSQNYLSELGEIDGFILKNKSPSCGIKDAKIYNGLEKGASSKKGRGLFATEVTRYYPHSVLEDDGRLTNFKIREHFLSSLYILAHFRDVKKKKTLSDLRVFHQSNTLLFLAYSQKYSKLLDSIAYSDDENNYVSLVAEYEVYLHKLLDRAPRYTSNINVLLKSIDQFKDDITDDEMQFIWNTIDKYKNGFVPFSVPLYLVKGYIIRFNLDHLLNQSFFDPYPEELIQVTDSGKLVH